MGEGNVEGKGGAFSFTIYRARLKGCVNAAGLRECCRKGQAEVVSNSRIKIHQTWDPPFRLWVIWGHCCLRVAAGPCLPNGPITQLSPYFTRNPCTEWFHFHWRLHSPKLLCEVVQLCTVFSLWTGWEYLTYSLTRKNNFKTSNSRLKIYR